MYQYCFINGNVMFTDEGKLVGGYIGTLYYLPNFSVNLKPFQKLKFTLKKKVSHVVLDSKQRIINFWLCDTTMDI